MPIIKNLYDWVLNWSNSKYGVVALALMAVSEASFFPIPPDVLLIALCLGSQSKSLKYALICSVGSILGAVVGYGIGSILWWSSSNEFTGLANFFFSIIPGFSTDVFYSIKDKSMFYGKKIVIAGGGDSALDWTNELASLADVTLIHRR